MRSKAGIYLNFFTILMLSVLSLFFLQCNSLKLSTDLDRTVNLYQYRTFNFSDSFFKISLNEKNQQRLKNAISAQLHSKGYLLSYNPDLRVNAYVKGLTNSDFGYYRWGYSQFLNKYPKGTLFIDLIDVQTNRLVWEGMAVGFLTPRSSITGKRIDKVVEEVFSNYPR